MIVKTRWPRPNPQVAAAFAAGLVGAVLFGSAALALAIVVAYVVWALPRTAVSISGGTFRPLSMTDFLEAAAADELDAYDREQARIRAEMERR